MPGSELSLILSERFDTKGTDAVRAALSEHLPVGQPRFCMRLSAEPALTSFIQIVDNARASLSGVAPARSRAGSGIGRIVLLFLFNGRQFWRHLYRLKKRRNITYRVSILSQNDG